MTDWVIVEGVKPWDGRYELNLNDAPLTTREWGWLKRYADYLPVTLNENTFTDPEVVSVLAIVAMRRADKIGLGDVPTLWERLQDAPFGSTITLELGEVEEDDAGPPPESSSGNGTSFGASSPTGSGSLADPLKPTGQPSSATSLSDQPTLVS